MELVKNIFFNTDKLVENSTVKISYTGKLYQSDYGKVFVHYGFGEDWHNTNEIEMKKTELGFQAEIDLISTDSLNLCFRTSNNEWDNNENANYTFNIEPATVALTVVEESTVTSPRKLKKTYLWSKKIKLAVYKIIKFVPKIISGNYTKKRAIED
ncbi:MAG: hypothetical protein IKG14_05815 [Clostridia bacterium]|nr:hypothetical protein [Clostridia bacterium]